MITEDDLKEAVIQEVTAADMQALYQHVIEKKTPQPGEFTITFLAESNGIEYAEAENMVRRLVRSHDLEVGSKIGKERYYKFTEKYKQQLTTVI